MPFFPDLVLPSVSAPHNSGDLAHLPAPGRVTPENGSVYAAAEALRWPSTARPSPSAARRGAPRTARGSRRGRPRLPAAQHPGQLHHPTPPPRAAPAPRERPRARPRCPRVGRGREALVFGPGFHLKKRRHGEVCASETARHVFSHLDYPVALSEYNPCILGGPFSARLVDVIPVLLSIPLGQDKKGVSSRYKYIH